MRRGIRLAMTGYVPAAAGTAALAGMILLGTAPAQAATAVRSHPLAHGRMRPLAPAAGAGQPMRAKATPDSRAVCAAAKAGYVTCMALLRTEYASETSGPLPGATVTVATGYAATTNSSGHYTINVPDGTYNVSARAWGYRPGTVGNVAVSQNETTTENFSLRRAASRTLSGAVTDGSGHQWPLYASISVSGDPGRAVYTNPYTGQYGLTLPGQNDYTLTVKPVYPGYNTRAVTVHIGNGNATRNIQVTVDGRTCTAPGYSKVNRTCTARPGGLVDGIVTDSNIGDQVNGASVTSDSNPSQSGVSAATPGDPNLNGGFYWLFASTGATRFTAADGAYTASTRTVQVAANAVSHQDWGLRAGHLTITPATISDTTSLGGAKTNLVKFANDGTQPAQVQLAEANGTFTPMTGGLAMGAPIEKIAGTYTPDALVLQGQKEGQAARAKPREPGAAPSGASWASIASYPTPIMDNAVAYDTSTGNVYSAGGFTGPHITANGYVYSASAQSWSALPPAPAALEAPRGAFINGIVYVVGGWDSNGNASNGLYAYDPPTRTWSTLANLPEHVSAPATATLNGQLYVVGGCTTAECSPQSDAVYSYNPATNSWTQEANYPDAVAFGACAGIDSKIVCAGGVNDSNFSYNATYIYNPATNIWSPGANMPYDNWGMAYAGSGNQLQIADGVTLQGQATTDQAAEYNPATDTWSALPSTGNPVARGGGSCGLYLVGGSQSGLPLPQRRAQVLPGYGACGTEHVPWLSESTDSFTLNPGQSTTVAVTVDSSVLSQPGTYTAGLTVRSNSPYQYQPVGISLQANPPASWGKVAGQVTDASTGAPIAGATVQICTMYDKATGTCGPVSYTLTTNSNGDYQLWLNQGYNPLQIIAAIDGYAPASKVVKFIKGLTATVNFALNKIG